MEDLNISIIGCSFKKSILILLCFPLREALIKIKQDLILTRDVLLTINKSLD